MIATKTSLGIIAAILFALLVLGSFVPAVYAQIYNQDTTGTMNGTANTTTGGTTTGAGTVNTADPGLPNTGLGGDGAVTLASIMLSLAVIGGSALYFTRRLAS